MFVCYYLIIYLFIYLYSHHWYGCERTEPWVHDDVIKWKHFQRYWPFVRGIHRSPVNSPHKGQWREAFMFSLIRAWINGWWGWWFETPSCPLWRHCNVKGTKAHFAINSLNWLFLNWFVCTPYMNIGVGYYPHLDNYYANPCSFLVDIILIYDKMMSHKIWIISVNLVTKYDGLRHAFLITLVM